MTDFAEFEMDVAPNGTGSIKINEEEVGDRVTGYTLQVAVGQPPILTVFERSSGTISGMGIVQVSTKPNSSQIAAFLQAIDVEELERLSLEEAGWGDTPTQAMMRILIRWAHGTG